MSRRLKNKEQYPHFDVRLRVRFNEVDTLRIVWHGHYINYFEQAREAFGRAHGMSYLDMLEHEIAVPVTEVSAQYRKSLRYGDEAIVRAYFIPTQAAKIIFHYDVFRATDNVLCATGYSEQVFMEPHTGELYLYFPAVYQSWLDTLSKLPTNE